MAAVRLVNPSAAVPVPVITALPISSCNSLRASFTLFLFVNLAFNWPISTTPPIVVLPSTCSVSAISTAPSISTTSRLETPSTSKTP